MISRNLDGSIAFRVFLPHAAKVELLGDFTDWRARPVPMHREAPGWWSADLPIAKGEYNFCYLVDSSIWLADYAAHGVKLNGYGGFVSRVEVGDAPAKVEAQPRLRAVAAA